mmetsp:Transcript_37403/g.42099  ORF Transcript_37403/g.42099 Transcript_37403/m.42099 type:complete len:91 (-) Transcript_37403:24-296(-)
MIMMDGYHFMALHDIQPLKDFGLHLSMEFVTILIRKVGFQKTEKKEPKKENIMIRINDDNNDDDDVREVMTTDSNNSDGDYFIVVLLLLI